MVAGMVMPLADLRAIYELLFRDGVMVAKKDKRPQTKHPDVPGVKNLQVIRAMGSLKSRGFVRETFAWRHYYWYLTNEGIVYLREYLHLPPEIVPTPLQRVRRPAATLALAHRAARVQSVQGPTSYVPKPGTRPGVESQEALMERQGYRHKRMGGVAEEMMPADRTPRFRGRPVAAEQEKPKASWDSGDQAQPPMRNGRPLHSEPERVMEQGNRKKITMETASQRPLMNAVGTKSTSMFTVQEKVVIGSHRGNTQAAESTTSFSNKTSSQAQLAATAAVTAVAVGLGVSSASKSGREVPKKEVPVPEPQETAKLSQIPSNKPDQAIVTQEEPSAKVEKQKKTAERKTTAKEPKTPTPAETLSKTQTLSDGVDEIKEVVVNVEEQSMKLKTADVKREEDPHKVSTEAVVNDTVPAAVKTDVGTSKAETKVSVKKKTEVKITQAVAQQPAENNTAGQQTLKTVEMAKPEAEVSVQQKAEVKKVSAGQDMQGPKVAPSLEATMTPAISQQAAVKAEVKVTENASMSSAAKQTGPPTVCVEKITVEQKSIKAELKKQEEDTAKSEASPVQLSPPLKSADIPPEAEAVSDVTPKVSKSKKKKQTAPPVVEPTPTSPPAVVQLEAAKVETATTTVKDDPPKSPVPAITNDPPQIPLERMCTEEVCPAAAVQTEAPAHKGEEEPASLGAEKIEREVLKAKTSSSVREAPAAAPASATETGTAHKTSPRDEQGEPPSVAQHTAALAAVSASAAAAPAEPEKGEREERLSHTRASEQGKDLQSQTPAVNTTGNPPAAAKPQPEGVSPKADKLEEDEAEAEGTMRKKIVVVEEVIEVQQIANPAVAGSPPAQAPPVVETDDLDYDVLEQLAMERALLAGGAMIGQGTDSPDEWDHSLEEPEEKTWPNFQEGLTMFQFYSPLSISFSPLPPPLLFSHPAPVMSLRPLLGPFLGVLAQGGVSR